MIRLPLDLALLATLLVAACTDKTPQPTGDDKLPQETVELRRQMLDNVARNVVLARYQDFEIEVLELSTATQALAASPDDTNLREAARVAWRDAVEQWQQAELYQFGPAGLSSSVVAGEDLRDEIYSWPFTNACRVDQELTEGAYADPTTFATEPINVRGLDTLEYLLFVEGTENACAPNATLNTDGSWAALSAPELTQRRANYANTLAQLLAANATTLRQRWDPEFGNFVAEVGRAGAESTTYTSTQQALNAISDALFYLDKETKDTKLSIPAGFSAECATPPCLEALESPHALRSREHILANLHGLRAIYLGGDGLGFDDLLRGMSADALADDMTARINAAITAVEAIPGTLESAIVSGAPEVQSAFDAIRAITDLLKTQFVSVLDLELPQRAEGDND